jgi:hypothetical protein
MCIRLSAPPQASMNNFGVAVESPLRRSRPCNSHQKLAHTGSQGITRVPATLTEAQNALELATPETMVPLREGYCCSCLGNGHWC